MENTTPSQPRRLAEHTTAPRSRGSVPGGSHSTGMQATTARNERRSGTAWSTTAKKAETGSTPTPRWVAAAFDNELRNMALLDCTSERMARDIMKDASLGNHDWITRTDA